MESRRENNPSVKAAGEGTEDVIETIDPDPISSPDPSTPAGRSTRSVRSGTSSQSKVRTTKRKNDLCPAKGGKRVKPAGTDGQEDDADVEDMDDDRDDDPFAKMQAFMEAQFKTTNEGIKKMSGTIAKVNEKASLNMRNLERLKNTVESNADNTDIELQRIHELMEEKDEERKKEIECIRKSVEKIKDDQSSALHRDVRSGGRGRGMGVPVGASEEEYWRARRSLRIWPVSGQERDLWEASADFIHDQMRVPRGSIQDSDVVDCRRAVVKRKRPGIRSGGAVIVRDEVIVQFSSTSVRDHVVGHSFNLAQHFDDDGKPTAGVRMEVPDHLNSQFQDFLGYGRLLFKEHGKGFKRHVKFDDRSMQLYMDVKLPNSDDWLYVDHGLAKENRSRRSERDIALTRSRLTSSQTSHSSIESVMDVGSNSPRGNRGTPPLPVPSTLGAGRSGGFGGRAGEDNSDIREKGSRAENQAGSLPNSSTLTKFRGKQTAATSRHKSSAWE